MAGTTEDIRQFMISKGETVPDSATFAQKMQNPNYVENVRQYMSSIGEQVPDSATFSNRYQSQPVPQAQPQQPSQDPLLANSDTNGQTTLEPDNGNPVANADQVITSTLNKYVAQPVKDYFSSFATSPVNPAAPEVVKQAIYDKANDIQQHPIRNAVELGAMAIPVAGDYSIAQSALSPLWKGLASTAINGGYEAARSKLENGVINPISTGISALTGGIGGFLGGGVAGKVAQNEADLAAAQAALQAKREAQSGIVSDLNNATTPYGMKVLRSNNDAELITPKTALRAPVPGADPFSYVEPDEALQAAKNYMANKVLGNKVAPSSISDLEAAKWMTDQENKLAALNAENPTINPLVKNAYNDIAATNIGDLVHKNVVNTYLLNPAAKAINANQGAVGTAGALFNGLSPLAGSLSDYAMQKAINSKSKNQNN